MFKESPNPSWQKLKHRLYNAHIPKKLFKSIRENAMSDKEDEFKKKYYFGDVPKYLFRKLQWPIGDVFTTLWDQATSPHKGDTFPRYPTVVFSGSKKRCGKKADKVINAMLAHC